ncbi:MAG TPA: glycosyltransferase family 8 protein [Nevskiales bacterium]|nr:glycosyltransferase family 8 protein [Nevskiales bacterium]
MLEAVARSLRALAWWFGPFDPVPPPAPVPAATVSRTQISSDILHLACAADANYAPHCAAMLNSVLDHAGGLAVTVHFMHARHLDRDVLERLAVMISTKGGWFHPVHVPDESVAGLHASERITRVAWYRSLLPQLLPDIERVLYLDCDVLAVDCLRPLWETDLEGCYAAAVRNVFQPALAKRHLALGLPPDQPYFNSGVLLMNLALMRRDRCTEKILTHARQHGAKLIWVDQDSVNYVLGTRCRLLHPRWNCQNSLFYWRHAGEAFAPGEVEEATRRPAILHFEGPGLAKPWNPLCKHPWRAHYHFNLAQTPWACQAEAEIDWGSRLLRLLPMRVAPVLLDWAWRLRRRLGRAFRRHRLR